MSLDNTRPGAGEPTPEVGRGMRFTNWAAGYVDERFKLSGWIRDYGRKIFPDHWSFMLGEVALIR